jgi:hypothetical protein
MFPATQAGATMSTDPNTKAEYGWLVDYATGDRVRPATAEERQRSTDASEDDGGIGVIGVDGRGCYVED